MAKLFNKKYYSDLLWHCGLFFHNPHSESKEQRNQRKKSYIHHLKIFSYYKSMNELKQINVYVFIIFSLVSNKVWLKTAFHSIFSKDYVLLWKKTHTIYECVSLGLLGIKFQNDAESEDICGGKYLCI